MLYSYVSKTVEQGGWTGVSRFDWMLRRAFPDLRSVTNCPPDLRDDDVVITDNHLSLEVPAHIRTVVVNHGCGATHFERDPAWRTPHTSWLVAQQRLMFDPPNRTWVAPSAWVAEEFSRRNPDLIREIHVIPHWVDPLPRLPKRGARPRIIGDWRDFNKGNPAWQLLARRCPEWEFRPLDFKNDAERRGQYGEADLYLCLSLSEGGSYSMCDAEAAELPIVTTNVGNCREFRDCCDISWQDRDRVDIVAGQISLKLRTGRQLPSFYSGYSFDAWKRAWEAAIQ